MANARELALNTLIDIIKDGAYSNRALNDQIEKNKLSDQDRNFMTELIYGTLRHYLLLDFYGAPYYKGRVKTWVKLLVTLTLYQILFLDGVPEHAAISEAVNIARRRGGEFNGKLVNAILRELRRNPLRNVNEIENEQERLAIQTSHPVWLIRLWWKQFGEAQTVQMAHANNERVLVSIRVNTLKTTRQKLKESLEAEGIQCQEGNLSQDALTIIKGNVVSTRGFKEGWFYIQDEASMLVATALNPQLGAKVLDVCAAPGGKTTHIAQLMKQTGKVEAYDKYPHKIKLIEENIQRLGLENIAVYQRDATQLADHYPQESFDYILVDAPCSGLGILRRHPEVKLTKKPEDLDGVITVQKQLLKTVASLVKVGGRVVYSTCTVNRKENDKLIEQFLKDYPNFILDETLRDRLAKPLQSKSKLGMIQLFPGEFGADGFFIASLIRKG